VLPALARAGALCRRDWDPTAAKALHNDGTPPAVSLTLPRR